MRSGLRKRDENVCVINTTQEKIMGKAMTGVQRIRKFRKDLYTDEVRYSKHLENERERDKKRRQQASLERCKIPEKKVGYTERERLRKQAYRKRKREEMELANGRDPIVSRIVELEDQLDNMKSASQTKVKQLKRKHKHNLIRVEGLFSKRMRLERSSESLEVINENSDSTSEGEEESTILPIPSPPVSPMSILWNILTPRTKKNSKFNLQDQELPRGARQAIRKELGINLANEIHYSAHEKSDLCKTIEDFFEREDVSHVCPDIKRSIAEPNNPKEKKQIRWRFGHLSTLHKKFVAEITECSYSMFTRYVPEHNKKPNATDWGTCMCKTCLNPEMKLSQLVKTGKLSSCDLEAVIQDQKQYDNLIAELKKLDDLKSDITYPEWQRVKGATSNSKISRKVMMAKPFNLFMSLLIDELVILKEHLHRVHIQYRTFKEARENARRDGSTALALHIDWSENCNLTQAAEEKSAHYQDDHICIHAVYAWTTTDKKSHACVSDCTNHSAPAVFASIQPLFDSFVNEGIDDITIISDSSKTQYRNKSVFFYIHQFTSQYRVPLKWIYLESGHGKGIPDGIGASMKRSMKDLVSFYPETPIYTCEDLISMGLRSSVTSISISLYSANDVKQFNSQLPIDLMPIAGTDKCHEISTELCESGLVLLRMKDLSNEEGRNVTLIVKSNAPKSILEKKKKKINKRKSNVETECSEKSCVNKEDEAAHEINSDRDNKELTMENIKTKEQVHIKPSDIDAMNVWEGLTVKQLEASYIGSWVVVTYDDQYYIGVVLEVDTDDRKARVQCLEKQYGNASPQILEKERKSVWYDEKDIFKSPVTPTIMKVNRASKYIY